MIKNVLNIELTLDLQEKLSNVDAIKNRGTIKAIGFAWDSCLAFDFNKKQNPNIAINVILKYELYKSCNQDPLPYTNIKANR